MVTTKKNAIAPKATPVRTVTKTARAPKASPRGIEKKFLKSRPVCKVTFTLPKEAAPEAASVCLVGEFNDWSCDASPMARRKNGDFSVSLDL